MDLNVIVYQEKEFASEKAITSKVMRAVNDGFKRIALSVVIHGKNIANIPMPVSCAVLRSTVPDVQILHRLTVKIEETDQIFKISKSDRLKHYDLLAVEPANEHILSYLNNGHFDCDLITFTFTPSSSSSSSSSASDSSKLVTALKRANFSLPLSKGIGVEVNYADLLSSGSARRQAIACGQLLVDKTGAKNIILSSGSSSLLANGKSPRDVIYIGLLFGLTEFQSKMATFRNGVKVIKHAELRKNIVASSIEVLDGGGDKDDAQVAPVGGALKRVAEEETGGTSEEGKKPKITS
ncbi:Ribonuclease P protein subunit p30 [Tyrophagus putrescentiae]|nr:Ribonuclease P protein subunit p30 [Tyrophagus putrescentiae]